jgi:hypothetical protein
VVAGVPARLNCVATESLQSGFVSNHAFKKRRAERPATTRTTIFFNHVADGSRGFRVGGESMLLPMKTSVFSLRLSRLPLVATLVFASVAHAQTAPGESPAYLTNLSIRASAGAGAQTLIVGFNVGGEGTTGSKNLLIRGVGPTLGERGVTGVLTDPMITLFSGSREVASNDNWDPIATPVSTQNTVAAGFRLTGGSRDAALISSGVTAGTTTVQVTGVGGTSGIVIAEVYDLVTPTSVTAATPRLTNLSCRAQVGTDANVLIAGIVVAGNGQRRLLIRVVGPGLNQFNVPGTLADPRLTVFSGQTAIATNDNWDPNEVPPATQANAGAFPLPTGSGDAAVIVSLPRGPYTVQVSGASNSTGVALIEVYELP